MGRQIFPTVNCCFRFELIFGCAIYITVEVYLFAILSISSIYSEFKMITTIGNNSAFRNYSLNSKYYAIIFGKIEETDIGQGALGRWFLKT